MLCRKVHFFPVETTNCVCGGCATSTSTHNIKFPSKRAQNRCHMHTFSELLFKYRFHSFRSLLLHCPTFLGWLVVIVDAWYYNNGKPDLLNRPNRITFKWIVCHHCCCIQFGWFFILDIFKIFSSSFAVCFRRWWRFLSSECVVKS